MALVSIVGVLEALRWGKGSDMRPGGGDVVDESYPNAAPGVSRGGDSRIRTWPFDELRVLRNARPPVKRG